MILKNLAKLIHKKSFFAAWILVIQTIIHSQPLLAQVTQTETDLAARVILLERENFRLKEELSSLKKQLSNPTPSSAQPSTKTSNDIDLPENKSVADKDSYRWSGDFAFGYSGTWGNRRSDRANIRTKHLAKGAEDEIILLLDGAYGNSNQRTDSERIRGSAQYNHDIIKELFWLARSSGEYDAIREVDYRFQLGPGIGWRVIDHSPFKLTLEVGPNYLHERVADFIHNEAGARAAEEFSWKFAKRAKLFQSAEIINNISEEDDYMIDFEVGVQTGLTEFLDLRITLRDRYENIPADNRLKNDISATSSLVIRY